MMRTVTITTLGAFGDRPVEIVRREYSQEEKEKLLAYMRSFDYYGVAGLVYDCVTGIDLRDENGKSMESICYNDGEYCWSEQQIYHIQQYNAAVTDEFFQKVMSQTIE